MVTIPDKSFSSNQKLSSILYVMKKEELLKIAKRLDFYVSPNVTKDKVANRLAASILEEPIEVVSRLSKTELLLLDELINAGPNAYVEKKWRKSLYILQKWGLILTYEDEPNSRQYLLMPDEVREALASVSPAYIAMAKEGKKGPSAKELRMASMMADLLGHTDFTIVDGMLINIGQRRNNSTASRLRPIALSWHCAAARPPLSHLATTESQIPYCSSATGQPKNH